MTGESEPRWEHSERTVRAALQLAGDRGASFTELLATRPRIGAKRAIARELGRGFRTGEYRKDPPRIGRGVRGRWYLNRTEEVRALAVFDAATARMLEGLLSELPREDAPLEGQAEDLAALLWVLCLGRAHLLAGFLEDALRAKPPQPHEEAARGALEWAKASIDPQDLAAVLHFIGRTWYLDKAFDDPALTVLLARRKAARRALAIFGSHLAAQLPDLVGEGQRRRVRRPSRARKAPRQSRRKARRSGAK